MAEFFLSKIRVASADFVETAGRPVLERHAELRALLQARAGPEVAALFGEPLISRGNDAAPPTVSWYGEAQGEARPLASLPVAERDRVEKYLSEHLLPLRALADDPDSADLALGALTVYGRDDVLVQAGRPVIVNWGLMPGGNGANAASRPAHYAETLGRYLPLAGTPAPVATGAVSTPVVPAAVAGASGALPMAKAVQSSRVTALAWVPLLVLVLIAGGVLAWLLWPGTRLFHAAGPMPVITDGDTLNAARSLNQALRARQIVLEQALEGAVCRADGVLLLPDGRTPQGLLPPPLGVEPTAKAEAAPDALLPSAPRRVQVPDGSRDTSLLALIEARTVLILASGPTGGTTGSGFVIGPGRIVTNFHVIDGAQRIWVAGAGLDQPRAARVLKTKGPLAESGGDFALLQIEATDLPAFVVHVAQASLKLSNVIAAGYPGDVLALDADFEALTSGDRKAVPDLTVTDGTVNTEQNIGGDTRVLMHSAPLSGGNSGGPLIDMCGRLVGVNTFTRQGPMQNRGFALSSNDLLAFLEGTDVQPALATTACAPIVVRPGLVIAPGASKPDQPEKD